MENTKTIIGCLIIASTLMTTCNRFVLKGQDSDTLKTVKIGNQIWMAENLNVSHFRDGDSIPEAKTEEEWYRAGKERKPAWCYYRNDPAYGKKYGKLYNWYAVNDSRGLAPKGWHVPSDGDWNELINYLGGSNEAGGKLKTTGTIEGSDGLWYAPNKSATDEIGFSGLPAGLRCPKGGFFYLGYYSYWWSSDELNFYVAWYRFLHYDFAHVTRYYYKVKGYGFSVRCISD